MDTQNDNDGLTNLKLPVHTDWRYIPQDQTDVSDSTFKLSVTKERRLRRRRHAITILHAIPLPLIMHSEAKQFIQAASDCNKEKLLEMLEIGTDPCVSDEKGRTALHVASAKGHTEIVKTLLNHGANPNQEDIIGNTALHLACCTNHIEVITTLVNAGCQVEAKGRSGFTPRQFIEGRLRLLQKTSSSQPRQVQKELEKIIELLQSLKKRLNVNDDNTLADMAHRLNMSENLSDLDVITGLLNHISLIPHNENS